MTDILLTDSDARAIASAHADAATGIESTASSLPGTVDGGLASAVLGNIMGKLVGDADTLAVAHRGTDRLMTAVANDLFATDEAVTEQFNALNRRTKG